MGFRNGAYCKVWSVEPKTDTWTKCRISISRKNKQTGEYEQDFSGFVDFYGTAAASKASKLSEGARIKLGDVDVTSTYNKEKRVEYINYKCFSFDLEDGETKQASREPGSGDDFMPIPEGDDDGAPW